MKRFGSFLTGMVLVVLMWAAPARGQDKFILAYGSGT